MVNILKELFRREKTSSGEEKNIKYEIGVDAKNVILSNEDDREAYTNLADKLKIFNKMNNIQLTETDDLKKISNALGELAHAEGSNTLAQNKGSHTEGDHTIANVDYQHVQGKYNSVENSTGKDYIHIVGWGEDENNRKNVHTLDTEGNAYFSGTITAKGIINDQGEDGLKTNSLQTKQVLVGEGHSIKTKESNNFIEDGFDCFYLYLQPQAWQVLKDVSDAEKDFPEWLRAVCEEDEENGFTIKTSFTYVGDFSDLNYQEIFLQKIKVNKFYMGQFDPDSSTSSSEGDPFILKRLNNTQFYIYSNRFISTEEGLNITTVENGINTPSSLLVIGQYAEEIQEDKYIQIAGGGTSKENRQNVYTLDKDGNIKFTGRLEHGEAVKASGEGSYAGGESTLAEGKASHVEGGACQAIGDYSHAEGCNSGDTHTIARGEGAHAEGRGTLASESGAHAEGELTTASGWYAHAEGYSTTASHNAAHAEGTRTIAQKEATHAEGQSTLADATGSHAEGIKSQTGPSATGAHAEGYDTRAIGYASHAEGCETRAEGNYSHTEGSGTVSQWANQHVQGRYNEIFEKDEDKKKYAHIVGGGTYNNGNPIRKNIHTLDWNGNAWFAGDVEVTDPETNQRKSLLNDFAKNKITIVKEQSSSEIKDIVVYPSQTPVYARQSPYRQVAYGNGVLIAINTSSYGNIAVSYNYGQTWDTYPSNASYFSTINSLVFFKGYFFASGRLKTSNKSSDSLVFSTDGIIWQESSVFSSKEIVNIYKIRDGLILQTSQNEYYLCPNSASPFSLGYAGWQNVLLTEEDNNTPVETIQGASLVFKDVDDSTTVLLGHGVVYRMKNYSQLPVDGATTLVVHLDKTVIKEDDRYSTAPDFLDGAKIGDFSSIVLSSNDGVWVGNLNNSNSFKKIQDFNNTILSSIGSMIIMFTQNGLLYYTKDYENWNKEENIPIGKIEDIHYERALNRMFAVGEGWYSMRFQEMIEKEEETTRVLTIQEAIQELFDLIEKS